MFDIPVIFAPTEMREHEAICCAVMRRVDGQILGYRNETNEEIEELRWLIPIKVSLFCYTDNIDSMYCRNARNNLFVREAIINDSPPLDTEANWVITTAPYAYAA